MLGITGSTWAELAWVTSEVQLEALAGTTEPLHAKYPFTNTGDVPLTITAVKPSCGCTTAELEKTVYEPGESGVIRVAFEVGDRVGEQVKEVVIRTDDLASPVTTLTLRVDIAERIELSPQLLLWAPGEAREPKHLTLTAAAGHAIGHPEVLLGESPLEVTLEAVPEEAAPEAPEEAAPPDGAPPAAAAPVGDGAAAPTEPQVFRLTVKPPADGRNHRALVRLKLTDADGEPLPEEKFLVRVLPDPAAAEGAGRE